MFKEIKDNLKFAAYMSVVTYVIVALTTAFTMYAIGEDLSTRLKEIFLWPMFVFLGGLFYLLLIGTVDIIKDDY